MALTIAQVKDNTNVVWGALDVRIIDVTFDNSYPAGGYTITAASLGLRTIDGVYVLAGNTAGLAQAYYWNSQTGKLMVLMNAVATAAFADLTATTNISTIVVRCVVLGLR